jgi:hypothetical protein
MNIQNIKELSGKLETLGFADLSFALFQRICFKPDQFFLSRKIQEDKDWLSIQLFFKKDPNIEEYRLMYYDAILKKEIVFADSVMNGINVHDLDQQMMEIDWAVSFDPEGRKKWNLDDELNLKEGRKIEAIVEQLSLLGSTQEGKIFATALKIKYWAGLADQDLADSTSPLNSSSEFIQRFYFLEGKPGITTSEAYKFLLNKRLEKEMLAKEKAEEDNKKKEGKGNGTSSKVNSLLPKKRPSQSSKGKIIN